MQTSNLFPSIDAYQNCVTRQIDQLLAENKDLKIRLAEAMFELNLLRDKFVTAPPRLEVVNG